MSPRGGLGRDSAPEKLVVKLGKLAMETRTLEDILEGLDEADIETTLQGCPETFSDPLLLLALMVSRLQDGEKPAPEELLISRMKDCAVRLCLEWLQRKDAVRYEFPLGGEVSFRVNPHRLTSEFVGGLEKRHRTLHLFAVAVQNGQLARWN
jgi:hypothetical protein